MEHAAAEAVRHDARRALDALRRRGSAPVLHHRGRWVSGEEAATEVLRTERLLHAVGTRPRTVVAVLLGDDDPMLLLARLAVHLRGASVAAVRATNPRADTGMLPLPVQVDVLDDLAATVLLTDPAHLPRARAVAAAARVQPVLVTTAPHGAGPAPAVGRRVATGATPPRVDAHPDDTAVVTFTSGTTGAPRAVRQSYATWWATVAAYDPGRTGRPDGSACLLVVTPLHHTVASMAEATLAAGGRVVVLPGFAPAPVVDAVLQHGVTDTYLAVPHLYALADHVSAGGLRLPSLRRVVYSGTPAAPGRVRRALVALGSSTLVQLYGSTEAGGITCLSPEDHLEDELLGTVGRPLPGVEVRVVGLDDDREVDPGATGEVSVRSATASTVAAAAAPTGETGRETTARTAAPDGPDRWLRTGDLGRRDSLGYLTLVGRRGQAVKTGGVLVHPAAVERSLLGHEDVALAVVQGVSDADLVEHVHATVAAVPGRAVSTSALARHVAAELTPLHVPTSWRVVDTVPLTRSGKPDLLRLSRQLPTHPTGDRP